MARITVEDCLQIENNRFALVLLASRRTKQLLGGAQVLLKEKKENKAVVTALREIAEGTVRFMTAEEKLQHDEEVLRRAQEAAAPRVEERQVPLGEAILSGGDSTSSGDSSDSDDAKDLPVSTESGVEPTEEKDVDTLDAATPLPSTEEDKS